MIIHLPNVEFIEPRGRRLNETSFETRITISFNLTEFQALDSIERVTINQLSFQKVFYFNKIEKK